MDAGRIAEFDTPATLCKKTDGMFRGMCDRSGISLDDIILPRRRREPDNISWGYTMTTDKYDQEEENNLL